MSMDIFVVCKDHPADATPAWKAAILDAIECTVIAPNDITEWMASELGLEDGFCLKFTCEAEHSQHGQTAAEHAATLLRGAVWNEYDGKAINPYYNHSGNPVGGGGTLAELRPHWDEIGAKIEAERAAAAEREAEMQASASAASTDWDWD